MRGRKSGLLAALSLLTPLGAAPSIHAAEPVRLQSPRPPEPRESPDGARAARGENDPLKRLRGAVTDQLDVAHQLLPQVKDHSAYLEATKRFESIRAGAENAAHGGDADGLKQSLESIREFRRHLADNFGISPSEAEESRLLARFHAFLNKNGAASRVPQRLTVGGGVIEPGPGRIEGVPVGPSPGFVVPRQQPPRPSVTKPPKPAPRAPRREPPAREPRQRPQKPVPPRERPTPQPRREPKAPPRERRRPPEEPPVPAIEPGQTPSGILAMVAQRNPQISKDALARVSNYLETHDVKNKKYVAVADYRKSTGQLYLINMSNGQVERYAVARGAGGFSNRGGSHATSLGLYTTAETYSGAHGLSLRVDGKESTNNNARRRLVVIHGADYAGKNYAGRSWGCFAISYDYVKSIISKLKNGAVLIAHR